MMLNASFTRLCSAIVRVAKESAIKHEVLLHVLVSVLWPSRFASNIGKRCARLKTEDLASSNFSHRA